MTSISGIGSRTATGAFWTIGLAMLAKVVAFGCQIALAWFLLPKDLGLVGMVLSITSIAAVISGMILKIMLVQRQDRFDQDAGQVFWLSLVMGLTGSLLLAAAAPLAGLVYHDNRVVPLILLVSVSNFLGSAPAVYAAVLSRDLRFRPVAKMNLVSGLINNLGAVGLAALGFGPYSLILPLIGSSTFALVAHRMLAGKVTIPRPDPKQWLPLLKPAGLLMLYAMLTALLGYGANFIIGVQHNATVAGYYFWGFSIASQAVFLLAANLQGVLFPALTKLNSEPARQFGAFRKACGVLLVATVPLCVLQVLLVEPAIKLVFHSRWLPAAGVVQGLSIGLMTQAISILSTSLLMAQGAFGTLCWIAGTSALLTLTAAGIGGALGDHTAVAFAVGGVMLLMNLIAGWQAMRRLDFGWRQLIGMVRVPLALGVAVLVAGDMTQRTLGVAHPLWQCMIVGPLVLALYAIGAYTLLPEVKPVLKHHLSRWRSPVKEIIQG